MDHILQLIRTSVLQRLKTLKLKQKIVYVKDRKKLEKELEKRKKMQEVYGKKAEIMLLKEKKVIANVYADQEQWKETCRMMLKLRKYMYSHFEIDIFLSCLRYSDKLLMTKRQLTRKSKLASLMKYEKMVVDSRARPLLFYRMERTLLTDQLNLLKYTMYKVEMENLIGELLEDINVRVNLCERVYRQDQQKSLAQINLYKDQMSQLIRELNLDFLDVRQSIFRHERHLKEQLKKYIFERVDFQLLNLKLSLLFFNCFLDTKNVEKAYLILSSAFEANKRSVEIYLDLYIKYFKEKRIMTHFLSPLELSIPDLAIFEIRSVYDWVATFSELS